jgi:hypothetical protein
MLFLLLLLATITVPIWVFLPLQQLSPKEPTAQELRLREECDAAVLRSIQFYRAGARQATNCPACHAELTVKSVEKAHQGHEQIVIACLCGKCVGQYELFERSA